MLATVVFTLSLAISPANANLEFREATLYDGHVTLEVPVNWNDIPREVLDFYSLRAAEASGGRMTETYQYGFRPDDPEIDFALPQFLIQIRESGRLNYRQFIRLPNAEEMRAAGERTLADRVGPLVRGLELGETVFNMDSFALRLTNNLDLRFEGETSVESLAFLTERGLFTIHFYAHASKTETMRSVFDHVARSVRFDDELRYRPRWADHWPPRPALLFLAAALIIAVTASVLYYRRRHIRS